MLRRSIIGLGTLAAVAALAGCHQTKPPITHPKIDQGAVNAQLQSIDNNPNMTAQQKQAAKDAYQRGVMSSQYMTK